MTSSTDVGVTRREARNKGEGRGQRELVKGGKAKDRERAKTYEIEECGAKAENQW